MGNLNNTIKLKVLGDTLILHLQLASEDIQKSNFRRLIRTFTRGFQTDQNSKIINLIRNEIKVDVKEISMSDKLKGKEYKHVVLEVDFRDEEFSFMFDGVIIIRVIAYDHKVGNEFSIKAIASNEQYIEIKNNKIKHAIFVFSCGKESRALYIEDKRDILIKKPV